MLPGQSYVYSIVSMGEVNDERDNKTVRCPCGSGRSIT